MGWGRLGWSHPGTSSTADTAILCTAALQKERGICRHTDHPLPPPFQPPLPLGCRDFPKALQRKTTRQRLERSAGNGARQAAPHGLSWRKTKLPYCTALNQSAELRGLLLRAHTFLGTYIFQGVSRSSGYRTAFVQPSTLLRAHSIALQREDNSPGKIPIFFLDKAEYEQNSALLPYVPSQNLSGICSAIRARAYVCSLLTGLGMWLPMWEHWKKNSVFTA